MYSVSPSKASQSVRLPVHNKVCVNGERTERGTKEPNPTYIFSQHELFNPPLVTKDTARRVGNITAPSPQGTKAMVYTRVDIRTGVYRPPKNLSTARADKFYRVLACLRDVLEVHHPAG